MYNTKHRVNMLQIETKLVNCTFDVLVDLSIQGTKSYNNIVPKIDNKVLLMLTTLENN